MHFVQKSLRGDMHCDEHFLVVDISQRKFYLNRLFAQKFESDR